MVYFCHCIEAFRAIHNTLEIIYLGIMHALRFAVGVGSSAAGPEQGVSRADAGSLQLPHPRGTSRADISTTTVYCHQWCKLALYSVPYAASLHMATCVYIEIELYKFIR